MEKTIFKKSYSLSMTIFKKDIEKQVTAPTESAISRIENHAEDIKLSTLTKVAKALGKSVHVKII